MSFTLPDRLLCLIVLYCLLGAPPISPGSSLSLSKPLLSRAISSPTLLCPIPSLSSPPPAPKWPRNLHLNQPLSLSSTPPTPLTLSLPGQKPSPLIFGFSPFPQLLFLEPLTLLSSLSLLCLLLDSLPTIIAALAPSLSPCFSAPSPVDI